MFSLAVFYIEHGQTKEERERVHTYEREKKMHLPLAAYVRACYQQGLRHRGVDIVLFQIYLYLHKHHSIKIPKIILYITFINALRHRGSASPDPSLYAK